MRFKLGILFVTVFGLLGSSACSDEAGGTASDTGADVGADTGGDASGDVTPDLGDFVPTEVEPNDDFEAPQAITIPTTIRGTIGEPVFDPDLGETADLDFFSFTAQAGTVLRLTFLRDNIDAFAYFSTLDESTPFVERQMDEGAGLTRQVFVPVTGEYVIVVADAGNLAGDVAAVGGDSFIYELQVEVETVAAEPATLPLAASNAALPDGNGIRIYGMAVQPGLLLVDIDAQTLSPPSDLDSAVVLMNQDLSLALAENDEDGTTSDSRILYEVAEAATVNLVVDFYAAGANNAHEVHVQTADPGQELEPNDSDGNAWPLSVADAGATPSGVSGSVGTPAAPDPQSDPEGDFDFYRLGQIAEGDSVVLTVTPADGSPLQPEVFFGVLVEGLLGPQFSVINSSLAGPNGAARLEGTSIVDADYFAVVTDGRNLAQSEDDVVEPVGGPNFTYTVTAQEFTRTVESLGSTLPISVTDAGLSQTGEVDWYELTTPASADGLLVVTVGADAFEPTTWVFDRTNPEGGTPFAVGEILDVGADRLVLSDIAGSTPLALAVANTAAWPAQGTGADYDLGVDVLDLGGLPLVTEDGDFGDTAGEAVIVPASGSTYEGELTGTTPADADSDVFSVSLTAGQYLFVETYGTVEEVEDPGPDDPVNADTVVTVESEALSEPLENDDFTGLFSRVTLDVETSGTYVITVDPYCGETCSGGAYGLRVLLLE